MAWARGLAAFFPGQYIHTLVYLYHFASPATLATECRALTAMLATEIYVFGWVVQCELSRAHLSSDSFRNRLVCRQMYMYLPNSAT